MVKTLCLSKAKKNVTMFHQDKTCWISKFGIHPDAQQIIPEPLLMQSTIQRDMGSGAYTGHDPGPQAATIC